MARPCRTDISVALCTFNGERFLQEQLDSLASQTLLPDELVVVDDHSTDGTMDILESFSRSAPFEVIVERNGRNIGPGANYSRSISLCRGSFVATCDQDDVWLKEKLRNASEMLLDAESASGPDTPLLVHGDLCVVGEDLKPLRPSFMNMMNIRHRTTDPVKTLLVQNFVTGCTMMANRALVREAVPIPPGAIMHDWWFALIAAARGRILFDPRPAILYRQHSKNVAGARKFYSYERLLSFFDGKEADRKMRMLELQAECFSTRLKTIHGNIDMDVDEILSKWRRGGIPAVRSTWKYGVRKQGFLRNLNLYLLLLRGIHPQ